MLLAYAAYALVILWGIYVISLYQTDAQIMERAFGRISNFYCCGVSNVHIVDHGSKEWHGKELYVRNLCQNLIRAAQANNMWPRNLTCIYVAAGYLKRTAAGQRTLGQVHVGFPAFILDNQHLWTGELGEIEDTVIHELAHLIRWSESGLVGHDERHRFLMGELLIGLYSQN